MTAKLYLGDCLEILPTFPDNSVDAVITDPPYGIGFDRATWADDAGNYQDLMCQIIRQSNRICPKGVRAFWQALQHACNWHYWFSEEYRIFASCKGFVQYRPTPVQWSWDPVIWWGNVDKEASVYSKDYFLQRKAPFGANRKKIEHPCPRPIETVIYVVELFTNPGDTILDPFFGSGTTGVACVQTGRNFIGIEIEPKYFEIAEKRIAEAQLQIRMEI